MHRRCCVRLFRRAPRARRGPNATLSTRRGGFSTQTPISPICRTPLFPISQNLILFLPIRRGRECGFGGAGAPCRANAPSALLRRRGRGSSRGGRLGASPGASLGTQRRRGGLSARRDGAHGSPHGSPHRSPHGSPHAHGGRCGIISHARITRSRSRSRPLGDSARDCRDCRERR